MHIGNMWTHQIRRMGSREFVRAMMDTLGLGYHADTRAAEYVNDSGTPTFTPEGAKVIDEMTDQFASEGIDLNEIALEYVPEY